ncbi:hypothetical protein G3O08_17575 [Cryomorpha ignava]|uniref:Uncharacterized protein n=1 Tax=Cryomorpha ignava TaxID=101383 RepID=A0A7K3WUH6_9FLAO|nr:hypothetical protein [Cryomorpha ignava]NEN25310.1 hypothetical protein [Cryomorpha ignava]
MKTKDRRCQPPRRYIDKSFDFVNTKFSLAVLCCLTTFFVFGQTVSFPTDTVIDTSVPFSEKMDDVFGNLDLSDVTTNLLLDRAWPFAKPADCNDKIYATNLTCTTFLIIVN